MITATNNGWDFIKVGNTYQYKDDWFVANVTILSDLSNEYNYIFIVKINEANIEQYEEKNILEIVNTKNSSTQSNNTQYFSEKLKYGCNYKWDKL